MSSRAAPLWAVLRDEPLPPSTEPCSAAFAGSGRTKLVVYPTAADLAAAKGSGFPEGKALAAAAVEPLPLVESAAAADKKHRRPGPPAASAVAASRAVAVPLGKLVGQWLAEGYRGQVHCIGHGDTDGAGRGVPFLRSVAAVVVKAFLKRLLKAIDRGPGPDEEPPFFSMACAEVCDERVLDLGAAPPRKLTATRNAHLGPQVEGWTHLVSPLQLADLKALQTGADAFMAAAEEMRRLDAKGTGRHRGAVVLQLEARWGGNHSVVHVVAAPSPEACSDAATAQLGAGSAEAAVSPTAYRQCLELLLGAAALDAATEKRWAAAQLPLMLMPTAAAKVAFVVHGSAAPCEAARTAAALEFAARCAQGLSAAAEAAVPAKDMKRQTAAALQAAIDEVQAALKRLDEGSSVQGQTKPELLQRMVDLTEALQLLSETLEERIAKSRAALKARDKQLLKMRAERRVPRDTELPHLLPLNNRLGAPGALATSAPIPLTDPASVVGTAVTATATVENSDPPGEPQADAADGTVACETSVCDEHCRIDCDDVTGTATLTALAGADTGYATVTVNGVLVLPGATVPIGHGDRVRVGDNCSFALSLPSWWRTPRALPFATTATGPEHRAMLDRHAELAASVREFDELAAAAGHEAAVDVVPDIGALRQQLADAAFGLHAAFPAAPSDPPCGNGTLEAANEEARAYRRRLAAEAAARREQERRQQETDEKKRRLAESARKTRQRSGTLGVDSILARLNEEAGLGGDDFFESDDDDTGAESFAGVPQRKGGGDRADSVFVPGFGDDDDDDDGLAPITDVAAADEERVKAMSRLDRELALYAERCKDARQWKPKGPVEANDRRLHHRNDITFVECRAAAEATAKAALEQLGEPPKEVEEKKAAGNDGEVEEGKDGKEDGEGKPEEAPFEYGVATIWREGNAKRLKTKRKFFHRGGYEPLFLLLAGHYLHHFRPQSGTTAPAETDAALSSCYIFGAVVLKRENIEGEPFCIIVSPSTTRKDSKPADGPTEENAVTYSFDTERLRDEWYRALLTASRPPVQEYLRDYFGAAPPVGKRTEGVLMLNDAAAALPTVRGNALAHYLAQEDAVVAQFGAHAEVEPMLAMPVSQLGTEADPYATLPPAVEPDDAIRAVHAKLARQEAPRKEVMAALEPNAKGAPLMAADAAWKGRVKLLKAYFRTTTEPNDAAKIARRGRMWLVDHFTRTIELVDVAAKLSYVFPIDAVQTLERVTLHPTGLVLTVFAGALHKFTEFTMTHAEREAFIDSATALRPGFRVFCPALVPAGERDAVREICGDNATVPAASGIGKALPLSGSTYMRVTKDLRERCRVWAGTWNACGMAAQSPVVVADWIPWREHDLIVMCVQNAVDVNDKDSRAGFGVGQVAEHFGFVVVKAVRLSGLLIVALCRNEHRAHVTNIEATTCPSSVDSLAGERGAAGVGLRYKRTSLAFVGVHLPGHADSDDLRRFVLQEAMGTLQLGDDCANVTDTFDHVFVLGDFGFAFDGPFGPEEDGKALRAACAKPDWAALAANDALLRLRRERLALFGFTEPPVMFLPNTPLHPDTGAVLFDGGVAAAPRYSARVLHFSHHQPRPDPDHGKAADEDRAARKRKAAALRKAAASGAATCVSYGPPSPDAPCDAIMRRSGHRGVGASFVLPVLRYVSAGFSSEDPRRRIGLYLRGLTIDGPALPPVPGEHDHPAHRQAAAGQPTVRRVLRVAPPDHAVFEPSELPLTVGRKDWADVWATILCRTGSEEAVLTTPLVVSVIDMSPDGTVAVRASGTVVLPDSLVALDVPPDDDAVAAARTEQELFEAGVATVRVQLTNAGRPVTTATLRAAVAVAPLPTSVHMDVQAPH